MKELFRISCSPAALIIGALAVGISAPASADQPFGKAKSENWGVSVRNTIGSPVAELRNGMSSRLTPGGQLTEPPYGKGSLGIEVANDATTTLPANGGPAEKADFGNEVDFFGDPVSALTEVGFHVFQTGENASAARGGPTNMPNIKFEIDPPGADGFSTMVWVPGPAPVLNEWSSYIDATTTGLWYFTGNDPFGLTPPCTQTSPCPFPAAKAKAGTATVYSVLIGKGRDNMWIGAVDGLRLNSTIHDFEENGVKSRGIGKGHDDDDDDDD